MAYLILETVAADGRGEEDVEAIKRWGKRGEVREENLGLGSLGHVRL